MSCEQEIKDLSKKPSGGNTSSIMKDTLCALAVFLRGF
jgi:hypothetical protein